MAPKSLLFAGLAGLAASKTCTPQFDGRIPQAFTLEQFDKANGIFNPSNVFGKGTSRYNQSLGPERDGKCG